MPSPLCLTVSASSESRASSRRTRSPPTRGWAGGVRQVHDQRMTHRVARPRLSAEPQSRCHVFVFAAALLAQVATAQSPVAETPAVVPSARDTPVALLVAAPRGGSLDRLASIVRPLLADALGRPLEIRHDTQAMAGENLASAAGSSPTEVRIALTTNSPLIAGRLLGYGAEFRPIHDFEWHVVLARVPAAVVVRAASPAVTLDEWLERARKAGRPLRVGAGSPGSMSQLAGRLLAAKAGVDMEQAPFADPQEPYAALRRDAVDLVLDGLPQALEESNRGDVRILAVTAAQRTTVLPQVKSFGELWPGEDFSDLVLVGIAASRARRGARGRPQRVGTGASAP